jgi:hypothetical protein
MLLDPRFQHAANKKHGNFSLTANKAQRRIEAAELGQITERLHSNSNSVQARPQSHSLFRSVPPAPS